MTPPFRQGKRKIRNGVHDGSDLAISELDVRIVAGKDSDNVSRKTRVDEYLRQRIVLIDYGRKGASP